MKVKVIKRPDVEAHKWVRDAWIGIEMDMELVENATAFGVVTGAKKDKVSGYGILFDDALEYLISNKKEKAAEWWKKNFFLLYGTSMLFKKECIEEI